MGKTAMARMIGLAALTDGWEVGGASGRTALERGSHAAGGGVRRRRRLRLHRVPAGGCGAVGGASSTQSCVRRTTATGSCGRRGRRRYAPDCAASTARTRCRALAEAGRGRASAPAPRRREKALVLFRHARTPPSRAAAIVLVKTKGWRIVSPPAFHAGADPPVRAGRLHGARVGATPRATSTALVAEGVREPTGAMTSWSRASTQGYRAVLFALLDAPSPGPVTERRARRVVAPGAWPAGLSRTGGGNRRPARRPLPSSITKAGVHASSGAPELARPRSLAADGSARRAFPVHACLRVPRRGSSRYRPPAVPSATRRAAAAAATDAAGTRSPTA